MKTAVRVAIALALVIVASAPASASPRTADQAQAGGIATSCSIGSFAQQQGVSLSPAATTASAGVATTADASLKATYPGANVLDTTTGLISAPNVPPIDGRTAVIVAFQDSTPQGASGPVGSSPRTFIVTCGLAFYDGTTGAFLADVKQLGAP